jgi:hypothetical protein
MRNDLDVAIATALAVAAYVVLVWAVEVWR